MSLSKKNRKHPDRVSEFIEEIHNSDVLTNGVATFDITGYDDVISMELKLSKKIRGKASLLIQGGATGYRTWLSNYFSGKPKLASNYTHFSAVTSEDLMGIVLENCPEDVINLFLFNIENL